MPDARVTNIDDTTLIARNPGVLFAPVRDESVMMDVASGRYYGLDDIGTDIWRRLDTPLRFAALVDALAADYDAGRDIIARDVRVLLEEMAAQNVVTLT